MSRLTALLKQKSRVLGAYMCMLTPLHNTNSEAEKEHVTEHILGYET